MLSFFLLFVGSFMAAVIYTVQNLEKWGSDGEDDNDNGGNLPETPDGDQDPPINIDFTEQKSQVFVDVRGRLVDNSERERVTA